MTLKVKFVAALHDSSGYSEASRNYLHCLDSLVQKGLIELCAVSPKFELWHTDIAPSYRALVDKYCAISFKPDLQILHLTPDCYQRYIDPSIKTIGYAAWETSKLPEKWVEPINQLDEIWCPSAFNLEVFKNSGVKIPVHKIPHAMNVQDLLGRSAGSLANFSLPSDKYTFYSIFQWTERKNPIGLLRAFFSEFTSKDNVVLLIKSYLKSHATQEKDFIRAEINRVRQSMYINDAPNVVFVGGDLSSKEIAQLHNRCDCLVAPVRAEGWGLCLDGKSKIRTSEGTKNLEDVAVGDCVISSTGTPEYVSGLTSRVVDEELAEIRLMGSINPIIGTSDHPHAVVSLPLRGYQRRRTISKIHQDPHIPVWTRLGDVKFGDLLAVPKIKYPALANVTLDVAKLAPDSKVCVDGYSLHSHGFKITNPEARQQIAAEEGISSNHISWLMKRGPLHSERARRICEAMSASIYKAKQIFTLSSVQMTDSLAEVFGYYIAEGNVSREAVEFASHGDEDYARNLIQSELSQLTNAHIGIRKRKDKNACSTYVYNKILISVFSKLFGTSSSTKRVPKFLRESDYRAAILRGIFYGDGCFTRSDFKFDTTSSQLADDIWSMLNSLGIYAHRSFRSISADGGSGCYSVRIPRQFAQRFIDIIKPMKYSSACELDYDLKYRYIVETSDFFLVPVVSVKTKAHHGRVFNLHVNGSNTYTVSDTLTHNCNFEAMAFGKPVISTNYSGHLEFMNNENSYLADYQLTPCQGMPWPLYTGRMSWAEPSIDHLKQLMRHVYEHQDEARAKGAKAAEDVRRFNWENVGDLIMERIQAVMGVGT